jgi:hypothetical protein
MQVEEEEESEQGAALVPGSKRKQQPAALGTGEVQSRGSSEIVGEDETKAVKKMKSSAPGGGDDAQDGEAPVSEQLQQGAEEEMEEIDMAQILHEARQQKARRDDAKVHASALPLISLIVPIYNAQRYVQSLFIFMVLKQ